MEFVKIIVLVWYQKIGAIFVQRVCFSSVIRGALLAWFVSLSSFAKCELEKKALQYMDTALCELGIPGLQNFNAQLFVMFASSVSLCHFFRLLLFHYLSEFYFFVEDFCPQKV